jgi:tRNA (guanine37-N1)-methyltransferase
MRRRGRIVTKALTGVLPENKLAQVVRALDIVGDIAIVKIPEPIADERFLIAETLMNRLHYIKTVLRQVGAVQGQYRTRSLEWLCGERRTVALHREHGCIFAVDLAAAYFSPRLLHERIRIAELSRNSGVSEKILNMFSGVGCFSIVIAKKTSQTHVYSVDLNPHAIRYQLRNIRMNKANGSVTAVFGESKQIAEALLRGRLHRVLMPLPEKAYEYLGAAIASIRPEGGTIHYYDFVHARNGEDPIRKTAEKVDLNPDAKSRHVTLDSGRIVRSTGPNWYQVALDLHVN